MMSARTLETIVGAFLLAGLLALLALTLQVSGFSFHQRSYQITAVFNNIGDLRVRAPVAISGVRIGEVTDIYLDKKTFKAIVTLQIDAKQNTIPVDSSANIYTQGLLGANYVNIVPGYANDNLKNGDKIVNTHSALILENLIGQLMYKFGNTDQATQKSS